MPLPPSSFGVFEAGFNPATHAVPHHIAGAGRQVGYNEPGVGIARLVTSQQRTTQALRLVHKTLHGSCPGTTCHRHQRGKPAKRLLALWSHFASHVDTQKWMPAQRDK